MIVIKYILNNKIINQKRMSEKVKVSTPYINDIMMHLKQLDIVIKKSQFYYLNDPFKLLQLISYERPFNGLKKMEIRLEIDNIIDSEKIIKKICNDNNIKYSFTMFNGLKRYFEYHINYPSIHLYIENMEIINKFPRGEGPIPIIFIEPDHKFILNDVEKINDFIICDKAQILIDLFSSGIGKDSAYKFMNVIKT
jgi:hypothetical protein